MKLYNVPVCFHSIETVCKVSSVTYFVRLILLKGDYVYKLVQMAYLPHICMKCKLQWIYCTEQQFLWLHSCFSCGHV